MGTDARKHTAPISTETPRRQALNDLSLTVNDVIMATNATDRTTTIPAALTAAGYSATAARPIIVRQQDTNQYWTYDGTTWRSLFGPDMIRIKGTALSGFGAGVYTGLTGFTTDYTVGDTATFTHSAGLITVNKDGVYTCAASFGASTTGLYVEVKIETAAGRALARGGAGFSTYNPVISISSTDYLTSGTAVRMFLYNGTGTLSASADSAGTPFGVSVTRLAGSL